MPDTPIQIGTKIAFGGYEWEVTSTATRNYRFERKEGDRTVHTCLPAEKVKSMIEAQKTPTEALQ